MVLLLRSWAKRDLMRLCRGVATFYFRSKMWAVGRRRSKRSNRFALFHAHPVYGSAPRSHLDEGLCGGYGWSLDGVADEDISELTDTWRRRQRQR